MLRTAFMPVERDESWIYLTAVPVFADTGSNYSTTITNMYY